MRRHPDSLWGILHGHELTEPKDGEIRGHELVWHHSKFGEYGNTKIYVAKKCKKTGKLVDLPPSDLSGPGKMRLRYSFGQLGIMTKTPENMTNLEQPLESALFLRPDDEGYDPVISGRFTAEMEYMNDLLNERRVK